MSTREHTPGRRAHKRIRAHTQAQHTTPRFQARERALGTQAGVPARQTRTQGTPPQPVKRDRLQHRHGDLRSTHRERGRCALRKHGAGRVHSTGNCSVSSCASNSWASIAFSVAVSCAGQARSRPSLCACCDRARMCGTVCARRALQLRRVHGNHSKSLRTVGSGTISNSTESRATGDR